MNPRVIQTKGYANADGGSTTPYVATLDAPVQRGDLIVAGLISAYAMTFPARWVRHTHTLYSPYWYGDVWTKVADGGERSVTITHSAWSGISVHFVVLRGAADPRLYGLDVVSECDIPGNSTIWTAQVATAPDIASKGSMNLALSFMAQDTWGDSTPTGPSGWTYRIFANGSATNAVAWKYVPSGLVTGASFASWGDSWWNTAPKMGASSVIIKPAVPAPGPRLSYDLVHARTAFPAVMGV